MPGGEGHDGLGRVQLLLVEDVREDVVAVVDGVVEELVDAGQATAGQDELATDVAETARIRIRVRARVRARVGTIHRFCSRIVVS